ncbi:hypothetical protein FA13DRAFT_11553 [Coprinellus micaceus]|uniref:NADAR domain-containing protein n=2 Tax=Coprinellus micaceus TaxID=71717 RepID=A0A4Y7TZJ0_COPMI|nr:hypothetical protein FA13DRAFT_11553 [Coprinellus micaceus]
MDTKNLIRNHISKPGMTGSVAFSNALWTAIPPLIPAITVDGRETILDLAVNDLNMSSDTVAAVAKALVPVFRDGSSFARSTAVELLSSLYLKHRVEAPGLVVFAVPEIVALALDDKDDVGTLRSTAISLLVAILTATIKNIYISESVFKQIAPQTVKFMALLRNESLRTPVVRLLSILSTDTRVRKTISLRIINSVISMVKANEAMENYAELLARLVAEERFGREPTDFLVLTLLPSVLERQQFVAFRTIILTALWCRYGGERIALAVHHVPKDLVEWLKFALFGRHATAYEVKTWCARCQSWLSAAGVDIYQNLMVSAEGSFVRETTPLATPPAVEEDRNDTPNDSRRSESVITTPKDRLVLDQWTFNGQLLLESPHPVLYQGESYPTAAHLFQAMKYLPYRPHLAQYFRTLPAVEGPELPYTSTQYNAWKRGDWDAIAVEKLEEALLCKFQQNDGPKTVLLDETGDTELVDIGGSFFMGLEYGAASTNPLGEALMRVRSRLRKEREAEPSSDETP